MPELIGRPEATTQFTGSCPACKLPSGRELPGVTGDHQETTCRECGGAVQIQRIYGVLTAEPCHGACMGATGPICECGCGGLNHGRLWVWRDQMTADEIAAYEQARKTLRERQARDEARREGQRQARRDKEAAELAAWSRDNAELAAWLLTRDDYPGTFLGDMRAKVENGVMLSENMTSATTRAMKREREHEARREQWAREEEQAPDLPTGKGVVVRGTVISLAWKPGFSYSSPDVAKITVKSTDGWRVYGTAASALFDGEGELKGAMVEFTADVEPKERTFWFFSRPRKARRLDPECCDDCKGTKE